MSAFPEVFGGFISCLLLVHLGSRPAQRRERVSVAAFEQARAACNAALAEPVTTTDAHLSDMKAIHIEKLIEETEALQRREELLMFQLTLAGRGRARPEPSWHDAAHDEDEGPSAVA